MNQGFVKLEIYIPDKLKGTQDAVFQIGVDIPAG